jgi:hypothetical protein
MQHVWAKEMHINFLSGYLKGRDLSENFGVNWKIILTKILTKVLRDFPLSLQANTGIEPRFGHDRSLPDLTSNPVFIAHFEIWLYTMLILRILSDAHNTGIQATYTECPGEKGIQNKIVISQKAFIIHNYGLHQYKRKLSKFFLSI